MPVPWTTSSPSEPRPKDADLPSVLSYFAERRAAGFIGLLLPPAVLVYDRYLTLGCLPTSISASYYTGSRDLMVGGLAAVAVFLISSIGYRRDRPWSILAGIFTLIVAFFPSRADPSCMLPGATQPPEAISVLHNVTAAALFLILAYFCLVLFSRTREDVKIRRLPWTRRRRKIAYIACGSIMLIAMAVLGAWMGAAQFLPAQYVPLPVPVHLRFVVEWICLWAFGIAWLVKGQQLLKDVEQPAQATEQVHLRSLEQVK